MEAVLFEVRFRVLDGTVRVLDEAAARVRDRLEVGVDLVPLGHGGVVVEEEGRLGDAHGQDGAGASPLQKLVQPGEVVRDALEINMGFGDPKSSEEQIETAHLVRKLNSQPSKKRLDFGEGFVYIIELRVLCLTLASSP